MASTFRHGLDLTPQNSDPAKIRNTGGPGSNDLRQFFGTQGLIFDALRLTLTSPRKATAVYVDKKAKTMEYSSVIGIAKRCS